MEANRSPQATLNDLIDRILDKGILLNTDLIISVAGIPLLGVNLRLALAGMETMLEYGIMQDWDEAQRAVATKEAEMERPFLGENEKDIFSMFGTHWYSKGIYNSWRSGTIYITDKRLVMHRKMPAEVLLEIHYEEIKAMSIQEKDHFTGEKRKELNILLNNEEVIKMHTADTVLLKQAIEDIMKKKELTLEENTIFPEEKEVPGDFLHPEEKIVNSGKMWYRMPFEAEGSVRYIWKPGHLYLTDQRLCWWYDFEKKLLFDISIEDISHVTVQDVQFGSAPIQEKSLIIMYKEAIENQAVCFYDNEASLREWEKVLEDLIKEYEDDKNTATCPRCGKKASKESLLENGCSRCGWVSFRAKK
ncbi:MAG: gas vesicle protein [Anaerotignum sp.]|nr:gas vesicle protein [Anaerotignum sp.]